MTYGWRSLRSASPQPVIAGSLLSVCHCEEPTHNLSLRGVARRRSNLIVEEIASPFQGSQ